MTLQVNETTQALDLAEALRDNQGTFIAQQGGQNYRVVARQGHSIVSLQPFGPRLVTFASLLGESQTGAQSWTITKISNAYELGEGEQGRSQRIGS